MTCVSAINDLDDKYVFWWASQTISQESSLPLHGSLQSQFAFSSREHWSWTKSAPAVPGPIPHWSRSHSPAVLCCIYCFLLAALCGFHCFTPPKALGTGQGSSKKCHSSYTFTVLILGHLIWAGTSGYLLCLDSFFSPYEMPSNWTISS